MSVTTLLLAGALAGCGDSGGSPAQGPSETSGTSSAAPSGTTSAAPSATSSGVKSTAAPASSSAAAETSAAAPSPSSPDTVTVRCGNGGTSCRLVYPADMPQGQLRQELARQAATRQPSSPAGPWKFGVLPLPGQTAQPVSAPEGEPSGDPLEKDSVVQVTCAKETDGATPADAYWYKLQDGRWVNAIVLVPVENAKVPQC